MAREALAYGDNLSAVIRMAKETIWRARRTYSTSLVYRRRNFEARLRSFSVRFNAAEYVYESECLSFKDSVGRSENFFTQRARDVTFFFRLVCVS